ncbi:MAG: hypothetical protein SGJ13_11245 [Actinomycetota bacterium]|nr:hypothetical protein [Actinomycetota bacterium]
MIGPPKSDAGRRTLVIPDALVPELEAHLERFVGQDSWARVFTGAKGAPIRRHNWWAKWAAATGASTRELMRRMGHSSAAAALRYQHATRERDAVIARALDQIIQEGTA